ncbi:MAG: TlpA disulfide reductase family protein [Alphaproteobacteria bacterium]
MSIVALTTVPGRAQDDPPRFEGYRRQYVMMKKPPPAPAAPFYDGSGTLIDLSQYRGKVVLLNLWATWCAPCVHEMPALNRLAGEMAQEAVAVVPVALDDGGLETVAAFCRHHGLHDLGLYLDAGRGLVGDAAFPLYALPVSYVIDRDGRVAGYMPGAADWGSDRAKALIRHYLRRTGD